MSAACGPATATRPAAVPSRRLFTIFISTSICCRGRIGLRRALLTLEGPLSSPYRPALPLPSLCPLGTGLTGRSDMGTPPSVARSLLARGFPQATTKRHFEHSQTQFPDRCCRKKPRLERAESPSATLIFGLHSTLAVTTKPMALRTNLVLP